jgi:hypothetical protein
MLWRFRADAFQQHQGRLIVGTFSGLSRFLVAPTVLAERQNGRADDVNRTFAVDQHARAELGCSRESGPREKFIPANGVLLTHGTLPPIAGGKSPCHTKPPHRTAGGSFHNRLNRDPDHAINRIEELLPWKIAALGADPNSSLGPASVGSKLYR